jgi:hypothetical protein
MISANLFCCLGCRGWVCLVNTSPCIRMPRCQTSRNWVSCTIEVLQSVVLMIPDAGVGGVFTGSRLQAVECPLARSKTHPVFDCPSQAGYRVSCLGSGPEHIARLRIASSPAPAAAIATRGPVDY